MTDALATSAARTVHFRDARPPHAIRCAVEREHMVLLQPQMQDGKLVLSANARINGAPCSIVLRFEAVLAGTNAYSLRIGIDWKDLPAASQDYHRSSAPAWLDLWLRDYVAAQPVVPGEGSGQVYDERVREALAAESHLVDVAAVQGEILAALKRGGTYTTSHKEGGTRIFFRSGRYVRSDYGDNPAEEVYSDDAAFLAFLRRFHDWQTARSVHPDKVDELTAWKLILRLLEPADGCVRPAPAGGSGGASARRLRTPRGGARLALLVAVVGLAGAAAWSVLSGAVAVKTTGTPLLPAVGSPGHVAVLIVTQEPYLPSLHRDASKDRYRISLLVQPRAAGGSRVLVPVLDRLDASQSREAARMLGFDGRHFWLLARDIAGYDPAARRMVKIDDLRRANPALDSLWPVGFYEVGHKLQVSTRDNRLFVEVDPETLVARTLAGPPARRRPLPAHPVTSLLASAPPRGGDTLDPAYVRERPDAPALRLDAPESSLLTYWRKTGTLQRMLFVARVAPDGRSLWETETGIGELHQVLPDRHALALIGTRPRVPDKVPEPVLVILRNDTGAATLHSLWIPN